jgi:hypothetical protein
MRRPAHGATTRPGPGRPASGYGRAVGRPGPYLIASADAAVVVHDPARVLEPAWFSETAAGSETPAPVTP